MNGFLYEFVALALQASQAHNMTVPGGRKYNIPSENITIDDTVAATFQNMTSYSLAAISGADDVNDGNTTIKDIFDIIVETTREVTPACKSSTIRSPRFILLTRPPIKSEPFGHLGKYDENRVDRYLLTAAYSDTSDMGGLSAL